MARWKDIEYATSPTIPLQAIINDNKVSMHLREELNALAGSIPRNMEQGSFKKWFDRAE